ncbi:MAG: O-antigen ligase family protein [Deinococcales bacterium]
MDSRVEGTIYQVLLLLFMVGAYFNLKNNSYKTYFNFICLSLLFQAIVIFQQYLENPLEVFGIPLSFITYGEVSGIVGRAAFAASLMLPGVFIGFVGTSDKSIIIKTMSYLTIFFTTLAISLTENRSSILAATVGLTVFLFFNIKNIKRVVQIVGCIVIANFGTNLFPNELKENRSFTNSQTLETRLEMWKIALKLLPSSWGFPIWGGGTGEFKLTIAKHLPARDLLTVLQKEYAWQPNENISKIELISPQNAPIRQKTYKVTYKDGTSKFAFQVIDRAHNFFLDRIYSIGLLGAVLWIIFYTYPIFAYFRLRPEQKTTEIQVLVASLVAIQVYHIFWFSVMQVEPIHVVIALMAWVRIQKPQPNLSAATMT